LIQTLPQISRGKRCHAKGVENWRQVVPAAELPIIEEHLSLMGR
jgi:hypothetical protein